MPMRLSWKKSAHFRYPISTTSSCDWIFEFCVMKSTWKIEGVQFALLVQWMLTWNACVLELSWDVGGEGVVRARCFRCSRFDLFGLLTCFAFALLVLTLFPGAKIELQAGSVSDRCFLRFFFNKNSLIRFIADFTGFFTYTSWDRNVIFGAIYNPISHTTPSRIWMTK